MDVTSHYRPPRNLHDFLQLVTDRDFRQWYEPGPEISGAVLNLGAGNKHIIGQDTALDLPNWDADFDKIPYEDGTVRKIYAIHFLEHIHWPVEVLRECQRVLAPGGVMNIGLPYYTSQGAYHDLDHKSFWTEETWRNLFSNPYYDKNHDGWKFDIGLNVIAGLVERNVMLLTQLIRKAD